MKLTAQEEYGLRCLLQLARLAPSPDSRPVAIRDVAAAEGLSCDYAAKLLRVLRQQGLVVAERGASGGFRLARAPAELPLSEVMTALDTPLFGGEGFCQAHRGHAPACVHDRGCSLRVLWQALDEAIGGVLRRLTLADLLDLGETQLRIQDNAAAQPLAEEA